MSTYGNLKTRIENDLDRSGSFIAEAIQEAISQHETERFTFNDVSLRLNTIADQEFYSLPATLTERDGAALATGETLLEIDSATIIYNQTGYELSAYQDGEAEIHGLTSYRGQPTGYSWTDTQIRLEPVPDQAYTIYLNGLKRLSTLAVDTDSNAWMSNPQAYSLIRETAKGMIYRDYLRNEKQAATADESARRALHNLRLRYSAQSTGMVRACY